jgi:putative adenylate-forming enzyme
MGLRYQAARLADVGRTLRGMRAAEAAERLSPEERKRLQDERLGSLVRHAATHAPVYRDLYRGVDMNDPIVLESLPPTAKEHLMERFDDWVTDRRLRLADLERHLDSLEGDELLHRDYRVMATGGTSGRRGVFVYSRAEWVTCLTGFMRSNALIGIAPRIPRLRIASVTATSPMHMTARLGMAVSVGLHRVLRLDARRPAADAIAPLARFRPQVLIGYPSALALIADEQLAGRLQIAPATVATTSEVRTPEMRDRIHSAWGAEPHNVYGVTEGGVVGTDCDRHTGLHLSEDLVVFENLDEGGRPVPDGAVGRRLLVTNLYNRTQPIIRYELSDMATIDSRPCACGRTLRRIVSLEGRSDDILRLPRTGGGEVAVHPITVRSPFAGLAEVRQYQVVHDEHGLHIRVSLRGGTSEEEAAARIRAGIGAKLAEVGAEPPPIGVEVVAEIPRDQRHSGKLKLIESRLPRRPERPAG